MLTRTSWAKPSASTFVARYATTPEDWLALANILAGSPLPRDLDESLMSFGSLSFFTTITLIRCGPGPCAQECATSP